VKFIIYETSVGRYGYDIETKKPCKNATYVRKLDGCNAYTEYTIEINSINDIIALIKEVDTDIIISGNNIIEIYDDYRE
jgi:hypothetical protein